MNAIYRVPVRAKLARPEKITPAQRDLLESMYRHTGLKPDFFGGALGGTAGQPTVRTPRLLADGADSMGRLMSMARVSVNEGSGWNTWGHTMALNPFNLKESLARNLTTKEFDLNGARGTDP